jgi:16S rRNA (cytidine1402-2'-O)-methyltransferase
MSILYLIPTPISTNDVLKQITSEVVEVVQTLDTFIVEDIKNARRFLKAIGYQKSFNDLFFLVLNEHTRKEDFSDLIQPLTEGRNIGLMTDAGCPAIADPGSWVVTLAHQYHYEVRPLVGPNSILLSLMASGLNGQQFAFNGYLPREQNERVKAIKHYERIAKQQHQTQIFIETPYRNQALLNDLIKTLDPSVKLCVSINLFSPQQKIISKSIHRWRTEESLVLEKLPAVFLFGYL